MSENEEKYSVYIAYHSNISNHCALFAGFMFAVITIFLTQFSDPSQPTAQIVLFVFTLMLDLFLYQLRISETVLGNCIRVAPPIPQEWIRLKKIGFEWWIYTIGWILLSMSPALMYFLLNLFYLSLATVTMSTGFIIFTYLTNIRPILSFEKLPTLIRK